MEAVDEVLKLYPVKGKAILKEIGQKLQMTREPFKSETFQVR